MLQDNNPPALIYCRVSSDKQVRDGHGLSSQETRCREYARHKGYNVVQVFHEQGISGKLLDRVQMQAMLGFLTKNKQHPHIVIIDDISRLARSVEAHITLRNAIAAAGGKLESPSIEFGEDSDSRLVEHLLASVAAHQREKNAEQVKNRMRARVLNGYWVSGAPIGYKYAKQPEHGKILVRDEPVAGILATALKSFASGKLDNPSDMKRFLESQAEFPKNKKGEVYLQRVFDILNRVLYSGRITMPEWGIRNHPAKHEALITFEEWVLIQKRLKDGSNAPTRKNISDDFPLRGFVTCSACDMPMTSGFSKGRSRHYGYYNCHQKSCDLYGKSIKKELVESEFETLLKDITPPENAEEAITAIFKKAWEKRTHDRQRGLFATKNQLTDIERKIGGLIDRVVEADNGSLVAAYEKKIRELEDQKIILLEKIADQGRSVPDYNGHLRTALKMALNAHEIWVSGNLSLKRTVLKLCFTDKMSFDKKEGFRTAPISLPIRLAGQIAPTSSYMVEAAGLEPASISTTSAALHA